MLITNQRLRTLNPAKMKELTEDPRFKARLAKIYSIPINKHYDIPFVSAVNEDGSVVYIDRHFNSILNTRDISRFIKVHEIVEKAILDLFDVEYKVAHQVALHYEQIAVETAGIKWQDYCTHNKLYAKQLQEVATLPADIDLVPYITDPNEVKQMRSRMVKETKVKPAKEKVGIAETKISLQYHSELNPKLWSNFKLMADVRERLLALGNMWADYTHIPKQLILDVIMTGGNANYNYTDTSDIDVHVILSKDALGVPQDYLDDYLQDKKKLWSISNSITVKGYPIELYAQDILEGYPQNQGVYSLLHDTWLQMPTRLQLDFSNNKFLKRKVLQYVHQIDHLIKSNAGLDDLKQLRKKLKDMRGSAIATGGEFSFENLVFKELRNRGYLDKVNKYMKKLKDKELSL